MRAVVVMPTRGDSPWLGEAIESVKALGSSVDLLVVCPAAQAESVARLSPEARIVPEQGKGLYAALNQGFRLVEGDVATTWLNDDDLLHREGALRALSVIARDPSIEAVYGRVRMIDARGAPQGEIPVAHRARDLGPLLARGIMPLAQPGTWWRAGLMRRVGPLDETFRLAGDLDWFSRAAHAGAQFRYLNTEVASFRLRAGQLSKDETTGEEEKARALRRWAGTRGTLGAALRFKLANVPVYLDRIRRHGFVSMRRLYRQG